jgi:hypothetical protein
MAYLGKTLKNRIYVGPSGQYLTLKSAVDWFNASATSATEIILDAAATAGTFTITYGSETTAAIAYNASAADIKSALEALTGITTVTVTQVVASKEWWVRFDTATEGFEWTQSVDISGLTTTTAVDVIKSFYNCKVTMDQKRRFSNFTGLKLVF